MSVTYSEHHVWKERKDGTAFCEQCGRNRTTRNANAKCNGMPEPS